MKTKSPQEISDNELISMYINGDLDAIEKLINRYKSKVYSYIYFTTKNRSLAEDIFQDTFIKVVDSLKKGKYSEDGKFGSWVMRIAHNLIVDHYRKEKNLKVFSKDNYEDFDYFNNIKLAGRNIEDKIVSEQIKKEIRVLMGKLPDDQKQVVFLRHFANMSFKEIAEDTGVSINTALGRMRYALINLRQMIEKINLF